MKEIIELYLEKLFSDVILHSDYDLASGHVDDIKKFIFMYSKNKNVMYFDESEFDLFRHMFTLDVTITRDHIVSYMTRLGVVNHRNIRTILFYPRDINTPIANRMYERHYI